MDDAKKKTENLFLGMKKLADENNSRFLVAFIPSELRLDDDSRKYNLPPLLPWNKDYPYLTFSKFFTDNKIDSLRLLPYFQKDNRKQYYYPLDDHWNSAGHRVAAEAIAEKVRTYLSEP